MEQSLLPQLVPLILISVLGFGFLVLLHRKNKTQSAEWKERAENRANFEAWALEMCDLLDRIEAVAGEDEVLELCWGRFELAEKHGLEVEFTGKTSGATH